ncbi:MAG: hypothetical protein IT174_13730 [Acidobacteria bacterium]|nr:hypothetical protein [Acidobacteriota bacterium]
MRARSARPILFLFAGAVIFCSLGTYASAQPINDDVAPPPLKFMSKDEQARLGAETSVKKHTKLALELMSERLKQAEALMAKGDLDEMYKQLGGFQGLMDDTLEFLDKSDQDVGKVLNNYKRFEIGLREFRPRLELIRREIPARYEPYVRNLIGYLRAARRKAIEPLFSDTVVPRTKP